LGVDFATDADGRFSRFSIHQSGAQPGADETRVHRLAVGIYDDDGSGKLVRVHREELDVDGETTDVPALQGVPRENLSLVNDDDLTYGTLRLDPDSLHTVLTRIVDVAEPLPRALVWSATRQMTRNSEMRARDFVGLVIGAVHAETDMSVVQELLASASRALARYAEQSWARAEGWPAYADRLLALARSADAGSDRQLAFVDALCGAVLSRRHARVLAELLDHEPAEVGLAGLEVDTESLLRRGGGYLAALAGSGRQKHHRLALSGLGYQQRRPERSRRVPGW
jgi:aminopeptidase N